MMKSTDDAVARLEKKLGEACGPVERIPLLIALSNELRGYDMLDARRRATEALDLAKALNDRFWIASSLHALGLGLVNSARYSDVISMLEQASRLFLRINDRRRKAETDFSIGLVCIRMSVPARALVPLRSSFQFFSGRRNRFWLARLFAAFGDIALAEGEYCKALRCYRKALRNSRKAEGTSSASVYLCLAALYARIGAVDRQYQCLERSLRLYRKAKDRRGLAAAASATVPLLIAKGAYGSAERYIDRAMQIYHELGCHVQCAELWGYRAQLLMACGNGQKAVQAYRKGISLVAGSEDVLLTGRLHQGLGALLVERGEIREGMGFLRRAHALFLEAADPYYLHRAHSALAVGFEHSGDPEKALQHYKAAAEIRERYVDSRQVLRAGRIEMRSRVRRLTGKLERESRKRKKLRESLDAKDKRLTSLALQLVQTSEKLRRRMVSDKNPGNPEEDLLQVEENWKAFAQQFNLLHRDFSARLMEVCPELTSVELKVCSLVRTGLSSAEIAEVLFISKRTVDRHRENIRRKLGVAPRRSLTEVLHGL